ncbi:MAG: response regulator transcription factor [Chloroflexi bacterium]|nr:response regulator transcription factor [Chloroflexota bacterium]
MLRVALVDDHRLLREGLKSYLMSNGVEIVGEGGTGRDGLRLAREVRPDVLLMDLSMPEMDGLEATRLIKAELPEQVIVILTASEAEADVFEAVKSGAQGYLLKDLPPEQLIGHLEAAARGEAALSPVLAAKILAELARTARNAAPGTTTRPLSPTGPTPEAHAPAPAVPPRAPAGPDGAPADEVEPLTAREREVLALVVKGASNREIAEALVVSDNTVKYHLKNILQKLHLHNRAQVVAYALRRGMDQATGG